MDEGVLRNRHIEHFSNPSKRDVFSGATTYDVGTVNNVQGVELSDTCL